MRVKKLVKLYEARYDEETKINFAEADIKRAVTLARRAKINFQHVYGPDGSEPGELVSIWNRDKVLYGEVMIDSDVFREIKRIGMTHISAGFSGMDCAVTNKKGCKPMVLDDVTVTFYPKVKTARFIEKGDPEYVLAYQGASIRRIPRSKTAPKASQRMPLLRLAQSSYDGFVLGLIRKKQLLDPFIDPDHFYTKPSEDTTWEEAKALRGSQAP